jgi:hypothetical protein
MDQKTGILLVLTSSYNNPYGFNPLASVWGETPISIMTDPGRKDPEFSQRLNCPFNGKTINSENPVTSINLLRRIPLLRY